LVVEPWLQAETASSSALTAAAALKRFLVTITSTFGQSLSCQYPGPNRWAFSRP
jgi:hypothetical protein